MRIFIAGIMQGSNQSSEMHDQDYRGRLSEALAEHVPQAEVYDPLSDHQQSMAYTDDQARRVFGDHIRMCREVDLLIAYVPEASMGTAIEMWEAFNRGVLVIAVSPLHANWAVKFSSHRIYPTVDTLVKAIQRGEIDRLVQDHVK